MHVRTLAGILDYGATSAVGPLARQVDLHGRSYSVIPRLTCCMLHRHQTNYSPTNHHIHSLTRHPSHSLAHQPSHPPTHQPSRDSLTHQPSHPPLTNHRTTHSLTTHHTHSLTNHHTHSLTTHHTHSLTTSHPLTHQPPHPLTHQPSTAQCP